MVSVAGNVRPGLHLALVRGPDSAVARQVAYLLTVDGRATPLGSMRLRHGDYFVDAVLAEPVCDRLAHCFVAAGLGAHRGVMNVVSVAVDGKMTDLSRNGVFTADTPQIRAVDLDGDGVDEILGMVSDYQPDFATGTDYWIQWVWRAGRYIADGCRQAQPGQPAPGDGLFVAVCPI
ncbi:MAG: hypothetical protein HY241_08275 [Actinobacteria bacterium]|nr:hypothetical protein [Actinomycetota bacterium]